MTNAQSAQSTPRLGAPVTASRGTRVGGRHSGGTGVVVGEAKGVKGWSRVRGKRGPWYLQKRRGPEQVLQNPAWPGPWPPLPLPRPHVTGTSRDPQVGGTSSSSAPASAECQCACACAAVAVESGSVGHWRGLPDFATPQ